MESTGIYHRPIERFFLENNFKVYTINALYSKMYKRNLRKTKTGKLDCISLAELFFTTNFKQYIKPDELYLNMNALSRQYFALCDLCTNIKNRYKNARILYVCLTKEYGSRDFKDIAEYEDVAFYYNGNNEFTKEECKRLNIEYFYPLFPWEDLQTELEHPDDLEENIFFRG